MFEIQIFSVFCCKRNNIAIQIEKRILLISKTIIYDKFTIFF